MAAARPQGIPPGALSQGALRRVGGATRIDHSVRGPTAGPPPSDTSVGGVGRCRRRDGGGDGPPSTLSRCLQSGSTPYRCQTAEKPMSSPGSDGRVAPPSDGRTAPVRHLAVSDGVGGGMGASGALPFASPGALGPRAPLACVGVPKNRRRRRRRTASPRPTGDGWSHRPHPPAPSGPGHLATASRARKHPPRRRPASANGRGEKIFKVSDGHP